MKGNRFQPTGHDVIKVLLCFHYALPDLLPLPLLWFRQVCGPGLVERMFFSSMFRSVRCHTLIVVRVRTLK